MIINIGIDKTEDLNFKLKACNEADKYIRCHKINCSNENLVAIDHIDCKRCIFNNMEEITKQELKKQGRIVEGIR